nr:monovalent cation/H(+) antiporter subunit G [Enterovirga sp. DB1703]
MLVAGAGLALIGSLGLLRLRTFYQRVHAPTLGTTMGIMLVLASSMIFFTVLESRLVMHEVLIGFFMVVTTPITLMLLTRAALYRDRSEQSEEVPPAAPSYTPASEGSGAQGTASGPAAPSGPSG